MNLLTMLSRFHAMNSENAHPILPQSVSGLVGVGSVHRGEEMVLCQ